MARKIEASGVFLVLGEGEDKEAIVLRLNSPELDGFGRGGADDAFANLSSCPAFDQTKLVSSLLCPLFTHIHVRRRSLRNANESVNICSELSLIDQIFTVNLD